MKMKWFLLPVIALAVISIAATSCDLMGGGKDSGGTISWAASANGVADTTDTTTITFTFEKDPGSLALNDIVITAGTGKATKGTLSESGTSRELTVTGVEQGTVKIKITKSGISALEQTIYVCAAVDPTDITWRATTDGAGPATGAGTATSTKITFEFSEAVTLTVSNITIEGGAGESAGSIAAYSTATLQKQFDNVYTLPITVETAGVLSVKIVKDGIAPGAQNVNVYVKGKSAGENAFQEVTGIELSTPRGSFGVMNTDIFLTAKVIPEHATNQTIVWAVKPGTGYASATEATITGGNILRVTADKMVQVTATIANGKASSGNDADFVHVFLIDISDTASDDPPLSGRVTITGTPEVGSELTASISDFATGITAASLSYWWLISDSADTLGEPIDVGGEHVNKYTPVAADVGKFITVFVQHDEYSGFVPSSITVKILAAGSSTVTFKSVAVTPDTGLTTGIKLTFDKAIDGFVPDNITVTGITGVTKGALSGPVDSGSDKVYTLALTGIVAATNGTLNVAVAKSGITISGSPKTVTIGTPPVEATFTIATTETAGTTTALTLTFTPTVTGLVAGDITITDTDSTGATKGTLSGTGPYTLIITGVTTAGTINVKVTKDGVSDTPVPIGMRVPGAAATSLKYKVDSEEKTTTVSVAGGTAASAVLLPDGSGYTFTYDGHDGWTNEAAKFAVNLGTKKLENIESVTFTYKNVAGDANFKDFRLVAANSGLLTWDGSSAAPAGALSMTSDIGSGNVAVGTTTTISLNIDRYKASQNVTTNSIEVSLFSSMRANAASGSTVATVYEISDIVFVTTTDPVPPPPNLASTPFEVNLQTQIILTGTRVDSAGVEVEYDTVLGGVPGLINTVAFTHANNDLAVFAFDFPNDFDVTKYTLFSVEALCFDASKTLVDPGNGTFKISGDAANKWSSALKSIYNLGRDFTGGTNPIDSPIDTLTENPDGASFEAGSGFDAGIVYIKITKITFHNPD